MWFQWKETKAATAISTDAYKYISNQRTLSPVMYYARGTAEIGLTVRYGLDSFIFDSKTAKI